MPKQPKPHPLDPTQRPVHVIKRPPSQTFRRSEIAAPLPRKPPILNFGDVTPIVTPIRQPIRTPVTPRLRDYRAQGKVL